MYIKCKYCPKPATNKCACEHAVYTCELCSEASPCTLKSIVNEDKQTMKNRECAFFVVIRRSDGHVISLVSGLEAADECARKAACTNPGISYVVLRTISNYCANQVNKEDFIYENI